MATGSAARARELLHASVSAADTDPDRARELALQARVSARAVADRAGEAAVLFHLAALSHAVDRSDAFALAVEAADLAAVAGDPVTVTRAEHLLAVLHLGAGNHTEALEHAERAVATSGTVAERTGGSAEHDLDGGMAGGMAGGMDGGMDADNLLNTLAAAHHALGDDDRAIDTYEAALRAAEPLGHGALAALVSGNIARIHAARAEYPEAVASGRRAVELAAAHAPELASSLLGDLAEWYAGSADHGLAAACLDEARRIWRIQTDAGEPPPVATRLGVMLAEARVALARGEPDVAIDGLLATRELAREAAMPEFLVEVDDLLATAYRRLGRFEEALAARERHGAGSRELLEEAVELRLRTLRATHAAVVARRREEIVRRHDDERVAVRADDRGDRTAADQLDAFERLAILAEFRDADTGGHTRRVGDMAAEMAHAAGELPEWCERLRLAGRLHDIGKVAVPDSVLLKTGPLTVEEFDLMKTHTTVGHQILAGSSSPLFQLAAELALNHHEWWDGNGYPHGRSGIDIPLSGRIVALADVFDALCSERPYKRAWSMAEAARFVVSGAGAQFDPALVDAFVAVLVARHPDLAPALT